MDGWLVGWLVGWSAELSFFKRFIAKKLCTACPTTNKIVPLTNLSKCVYNDKSETEVNINNSSDKKKCLKYATTIGELVTAECASFF